MNAAVHQFFGDGSEIAMSSQSCKGLNDPGRSPRGVCGSDKSTFVSDVDSLSTMSLTSGLVMFGMRF